MTALRVSLVRFWGSLTKRRRDAQLGEEIQTHLDLLADEFQAQGMSPEAARRAAHREFGGVEAIKDSTRDELRLPLIESFLQDARFALRQLRRSPSFTMTAILTLAIGIGGTTAIFSVIDMVVLRPLPYSNAARLVTLQESLPTFGPFPVSAADVKFWTEHSSSFEQISLVGGAAMNLAGNGREPERLVVGLVTPNFFRILGASTELGRLLLDEENQPGRDHVVVLSDALWRSRFNGDSSIVGRTIELSGVSFEVVGVTAPNFWVPNTKLLHSLPTRELTPQMWKPLALAPADYRPIGGYSYASVARLKPGVTLAQARQELAAVQTTLVRQLPNKGDLRTAVTPLQEQMASRTQASLELLLVAVGTVLVIGCVNIANLLLSRTIARRKEISVREAIGAGRRRIARQMIVENLVLATLGGIAAVLVAYGALRVIVALAPADVPRLDRVALDLRVLLFTGAVSIVSGLLVGLVPAWRAGRSDVNSSLKTRREGDTHPGSARLRSTLVASEIGLTAATVAVAALLFQSFAGLLKVERGFDTEKVLTLDLNLAGQRYQNAQQQAAFVDAVVADVQTASDVAAVAVATQLPLTGTGSLSALSVAGTTATAAERPSADVRSVSSEYFRVMGLALKRGRLIEPADRDRNVAVLSEELAARGWPGQDPLGRRFRFGMIPTAVEYEVVGTVGDVRGTSLDQPLTPTAYVPFPQRVGGGVTLIVKGHSEPAPLAPSVRNIVRSHDPELPIGAFRTMNDVIDESLATRRFQLQLVAFFAVLAALLASVGVYGVLAYSVEQRSGELGIRLALGARPRALVMSVVREALILAVVGLAVAIPLTLMSGSLLAKFLVGVTPRDPFALIATIFIISATAIIAAAGPGFRASRVDPMVALRSE